MAILSEASSIIIQDYGPIGLLALLLWRRQGQLISAVTTLAEEHDGVDEENIKESITFGGD